jgi:hypothetical protein
MEDKLVEIVKMFMVNNKISCQETIYQCDCVVLNALDFIAELFEIVKSELPDME